MFIVFWKMDIRRYLVCFAVKHQIPCPNPGQPGSEIFVFLKITIILTDRFLLKLCDCYLDFIYLYSSIV